MAGLFTSGGESNYVIDHCPAGTAAVMRELYCAMVIKRKLSHKVKLLI